MRDTNDKLEEIFCAAVEIESAELRDKYLATECGDSGPLRDDVDRLLRAHDKAADFLEQSPTLTFAGPDDNTDDATRAPTQSVLYAVDRLPCLFGEYELLERISQGGMGVVYKARQISLNRVVAIKMILSGQLASPDEISRFRIEAEAAGNLDHPGIVPVFDVGCIDGQHYLSMAFIDGQSLNERIGEGNISPREAAALTRKLAVAIQVAHDSGIVHRDLKPGNVLLDKKNQPRITDFGLAKKVEANSNLTTTGMVLGTPSYMPPEQAACKEIDPAADVYSLGAIMYAMLTGEPPFKASSQLETILRVLQEEPSSPRKSNKAVPRDLEAICLKCLEKNPGDRYRSAAELSDDLTRFLSDEPVHAKNDLMRRLRKWWAKEPTLLAHLAATMVLLVMLVGNYWLFGENPPGLQANFHKLVGNALILVGLGSLLWVLQLTQNSLQTKLLIPISWTALNPICLTVALFWNAETMEGELRNAESLSWFASVYFLIIVTTCFFRRYELVAISTVCSLLGFATLAVFYFRDIASEAPSYLVVFIVNMIVTGTLLSLLTLKLKRLGEEVSPG